MHVIDRLVLRENLSKLSMEQMEKIKRSSYQHKRREKGVLTNIPHHHRGLLCFTFCIWVVRCEKNWLIQVANWILQHSWPLQEDIQLFQVTKPLLALLPLRLLKIRGSSKSVNFDKVLDEIANGEDGQCALKILLHSIPRRAYKSKKGQSSTLDKRKHFC